MQEQRQVLGQAARLLGTADDFGDTLRQTLAACLPALGDFGFFDEPPAVDDPALRSFTQAFGMRVHYIVPLVARGRTIGAMGVVQAESGRDSGAADRALIQELARRAALAIDNAHAYAEAGAARRQAESANRAKDEFLAMLGHERPGAGPPGGRAASGSGWRSCAGWWSCTAGKWRRSATAKAKAAVSSSGFRWRKGLPRAQNRGNPTARQEVLRWAGAF